VQDQIESPDDQNRGEHPEENNRAPLFVDQRLMSELALEPGVVEGCLGRRTIRANAEINFRNGGSAEGSLVRRGGTKAWPADATQPETPEGMGPLLPIRAPALSQGILSELPGRRPGRNGLSAVSSVQGQGLWTLAFASSVQTGHFASAIWKLLSAFALTAWAIRGNNIRIGEMSRSRTARGAAS
jgi:hypothetical protein